VDRRGAPDYGLPRNAQGFDRERTVPLDRRQSRRHITNPHLIRKERTPLDDPIRVRRMSIEGRIRNVASRRVARNNSYLSPIHADQNHCSTELPSSAPDSPILDRSQPPEAPLQGGRGYHGRYDHHDDNCREGRFADDTVAVDAQCCADVGKDKADLTAGNHSDANGEAIDTLTEDAQGACLLPKDGNDGEGNRPRQ
jgi:hypothetical protein